MDIHYNLQNGCSISAMEEINYLISSLCTKIGRGGENRTPIKSFGDSYATIIPHPCVYELIIA